MQGPLQRPEPLCLIFRQHGDRDLGPGGDHPGNILPGHTATLLLLPCGLPLFQFPRPRSLLISEPGGSLILLRVCGLLLLSADPPDRFLQFLETGRRGQPFGLDPGGRLIHQIHRLIRQETILDIAGRQGYRGTDRLFCDGDSMIRLVFLFQPHEDLHRGFLVRLLHHDRLEPPLKGRIFLDVLPIFLERGGADHLEAASGQHRL